MTEQQPVAVLGGGSFGTAIANLLAENGQQVYQWMRDPAQAEAMRTPLPVLFARDLEAMQAKVEAAGGTIVKAIFAFPGGRRFHFTDPDGYELAVWTEQQ